MPGFGAYVVVIFGFILMGVAPLLLYFQIDLKIGDLPKYSLAFFALIFFIRALALFLPNIEKGVAKEFLELNKKIYAPLCFSLGVAFAYLLFLLCVKPLKWFYTDFKPLDSSSPSIIFIFCTAAPEAPFPRLSSLEITTR